MFATDTVGNLKFPGTKGTFRYNIVRKNKVDTKIEDILCTKNKVEKLKSEDILCTKSIVDMKKWRHFAQN